MFEIIYYSDPLYYNAFPRNKHDKSLNSLPNSF